MTPGISAIDLHDSERAPTRLLVTLLAATATLTSGGISILAGWARGGSTVERVAWVFVGLVLLLSAHLIPALTKGLGRGRRALALAIWACAMLATGYGHATFFVVTQHDAGEARANLVPAAQAPSSPVPAGRSQAVIATDRATVDQQLASLDTQKCRDACTYVTYRRKTLLARRAALDIEMQDAKRRYAQEDEVTAALAKTQARREAAMTDPVAGLLSRAFGVETSAVNLAVAVFLGWLVESVACLAWSLALPLGSGRGHRALSIPRAEDRPSPEPHASVVGNSFAFADGDADGDTPRPPVGRVAKIDRCDRALSVKAANDESALAVDVGPTQEATDEALPSVLPPDELNTLPTAIDVLVTAPHEQGHAPPREASPEPEARNLSERWISDIDRLAMGIQSGEADTSVASIRHFLGCDESQAQQIRWAYRARPQQEAAIR